VPPALKRAARTADPGGMVQTVVDFMDGMPPLPLTFLLGAVVGPVLIVVHELGHAFAALWRCDGPVFVRVGAKERRWSLRAGRMTMEAGPNELPLSAGFCVYDATGISPWDEVMIAMAGPVASLLGAVATGVLWNATGGLLHDALAVATLGGITVGVVNALPLTFKETRRGDGPVLRLDGLRALEALRSSRPVPLPVPLQWRGDARSGPVAERWASEVDAAAERARVARAHANSGRVRAERQARRDGSIPPPGR
jgi:hypothetical protein